MLEKVDLEITYPKEKYKQLLTGLQQRLFELEYAIFRAGIPVIIVFEGWAAAGKGSTINVLSKRLDPRGFRVVPITPPRTQEMLYPWLRRYWLKIPAFGQTVVFDTSWYRRVLIGRTQKLVKKKEWQAAYQDIEEFESTLAADGTVILKFWLHISRKEQAKRFRKLLKDDLAAWKVSSEDKAQHRSYKKYLLAVEEMLARTDKPEAPWVIVEATDRYHTRIKVMEEIIRVLGEALEAPHKTCPQGVPRVTGKAGGRRKKGASRA
jgi:polyphosphate kinase 2 (PPK2 family)